MDEGIASSFVTAVSEIFRENKLHVETITVIKDHSQVLQVVSAIGITGDLRGNLLFGCSLPDARAIVNALFQINDLHHTDDGFGDLEKATIGEFANQIAGRALMNLSLASVDCNITPPTVLSGDRVFPDLCQADEQLLSQISGTFGSALVRIGIKTVKKV